MTEQCFIKVYARSTQNYGLPHFHKLLPRSEYTLIQLGDADKEHSKASGTSQDELDHYS